MGVSHWVALGESGPALESILARDGTMPSTDGAIAIVVSVGFQVRINHDPKRGVFRAEARFSQYVYKDEMFMPGSPRTVFFHAGESGTVHLAVVEMCRAIVTQWRREL